MKISQHRLFEDDDTPIEFIASPNKGDKVQHKYLVMHYTAGSSAQGAINTLTDPNSRASAHLVIARNGRVTQLVPFDRVAWHAGKSRWQGLNRLNHCSLGIELDNAGVLEPDNGSWRAWFGRSYERNDVIEAAHQHEDVQRGWHKYTPEQIDVAVEVSSMLANRYRLVDVLGHDDIAPGRKIDPGPAFPMESFRSAVLGRESDTPEIFETITDLNIRGGPGAEFDKFSISPLKSGTRLEVEMREGSWCFVEVLNSSGVATNTGWVHGNFIRRVSQA